MKLYTDLNIPLHRWEKLQMSQKETGNLDLRYLKIGRLPKKYDKKEYLKAYESILSKIPEIDMSLTVSWTLYVAHYVKYCILLEMNLWKKLWNKKKLEIQTNKLNKSFDEYLTELNENYKEFEFEVHGLKKDYKEIWDLDFDIPKQLIKNDKFQFFLFEEYIEMIREWIEKNKITVKEGIDLMKQSFVEKYISVEITKIDDLKKVNKRMYDFFRDTKQIEKWRSIRGDYFNLYNLNFKSKKDISILKQVVFLREQNNQKIPFTGPEAVTLREFYVQLERYNEKVQEQRELNKKRRANGE